VTTDFGDVLPSQSLGKVLKKLNVTQHKQTTQEQNGKTNTKSKPKSEETQNLNQHLSLRIAHVYACHCAQLS